MGPLGLRLNHSCVCMIWFSLAALEQFGIGGILKPLFLSEGLNSMGLGLYICLVWQVCGGKPSEQTAAWTVELNFDGLNSQSGIGLTAICETTLADPFCSKYIVRVFLPLVCCESKMTNIMVPIAGDFNIFRYSE